MAVTRMLRAMALWGTLLSTACASDAGSNSSKSVMAQLASDPDCAGSCSLSGFGSDMQKALFPNSEGMMNKAAYGLDQGGTTIDLPGFASFGSIALDTGVSTGSRVWKGDSDDLSEVAGCNNHPGLVEGRSYCFFSMVTKQAEPQTLKGFYSGSSPLHWNRPEGLPDARRLQSSPIELPDSICIAVNAAQRLVSLSMDPGVGASNGIYKVLINGASFSTAGCAQVPLMEYMDLGNKKRTGHTLPTQMNVAATLEVGLTLGSLELTVTVQAVVGMNLDLGGTGSMAKPGSVFNAMLAMDGKHVAPNWGVVIRASIDVNMKLGPLSLNPGSVEGQIFWTQTGWEWPVFHLSFTLKHIHKLSQVFAGLEHFDKVCKAASLALPEAIKKSKLCEPADDSETEPQVKIFTVNQGSDGALGIEAWGTTMSMENNHKGWKWCVNDECSREFCISDSQCPQFHQCCISNFKFQCQKIWYSKVTGEKLQCIDVNNVRTAGLLADPDKGADEGAGCRVDSDCRINDGLKCCMSSLFGASCVKKMYEKGWGGRECSCLLMKLGKCEYPKKNGEAAAESKYAVNKSLRSNWLSSTGSYYMWATCIVLSVGMLGMLIAFYRRRTVLYRRQAVTEENGAEVSAAVELQE